MFVFCFAVYLGTISAFAAETVWLDDLQIGTIQSGHGTARARGAIAGGPLLLDGKQYDRGIGHHAQGNIILQLPAGFSGRFCCTVGIDDSVGEKGHVEFRAVGDGRELWRSGFVTGADKPVICDVDISGVEFLTLWCDEGPEGLAYDQADWCDARIEPADASAADAAKIRMIRPLFDDDGKIVSLDDEKNREFYAMRDQITAGTPERVASQAYHVQATILPTDRDPLDLILRRTAALLEYLTQECDEGALDAESKILTELAERSAAAPQEEKAVRRAIFDEAYDLREKIALKNPLLDFDDILFIKRHMNPEPEKEGNHMCDQFFGFHARPGGGLFVLKNAFSPDRSQRQAVDLLADSTVENGRLAGRKLDKTWGFLAPHLSYDGKSLFFAAADTSPKRHTYTWTEDNCYHLFRTDADGKHLTQLTDGAVNDIDPYFMPNGRVVFISERRGGYGRCHARPCPSYTLHSMEADGTDIVTLSWHETNEWSPAIDQGGKIVYTRWDYVDRGFNQAHHPWITSPDGRDARAIQGNYSEDERSRPHFETSLKPVPYSNKLVATANNHHGQYFGSVILIDPSIEDDDTGSDPMAPVRRITPDQLFPESEIGVHGPPANYGQPFPLSTEFYLVAYDPFSGTAKGETNSYGLYLLDVFGNKVLLYRDPTISIQCPIPMRERETPPVVPHQTLVGIPKSQGGANAQNTETPLPQTAVVGVTDVYKSARPFPEGTKITELRIVQILPKTTSHANVPWIGYGAEKSARRVLGTVPVEADGSARFEMPVDIPVYFQALDERGVAVQTMRSATYVHPGETLTCLGCHEGRYNTSMNMRGGSPEAFQRKPSAIVSEMAGSNPFNYPTLVQTILDKHCVECHNKAAAEGKSFKLDRGSEDQHFFNSYRNLRPYVFVFASQNNTRFNPPIPDEPNNGNAYDQFLNARTFPGQFGANASKLWHLLEDGHYDVKLTPAEKRSLALWLDNNADFYGAYELETLAEQRQGKSVAPTLE